MSLSPSADVATRDLRLTAVLGPTNTGKTHLAIERMLGHESGMIGLPLRLLAREVYDKIKTRTGTTSVALITGEEKIIPLHPRYWVCTVEAMPLDIEVAFLAVDEIQLCADPERGHVFTHRLLHARGTQETMFMGADTMRPLIRHLLPHARYVNRPRFSELSYTGQKKLTRLPRRTAIVAFSATEVYAIAELIRRQRGGAAIVMGALSPRTRNAQVGLYQSGEVDFIVATDAIGMGLNMDVDHVAFASLSKFDGRDHRPLSAAELAQIAGRAGRFENDGTFGTTADAPVLPPEIAEQIEQHQFEPLRILQWRNSNLDYSSLQMLQASLEAPPPKKGLARSRQSDDLLALLAMSRDERIRTLAVAPAAIKKLWDVCQVPDFRKTLASEHVALLTEIYLSLMGPQERISPEWMAAHMKRLDHIEGDIDTLAQRLAHVRTLSFISHRSEWLGEPLHWQERAREVENRLSDALHERLTQTFIDRRTSTLMRRLNDSEPLLASVNEEGDVLVEGEFVGRLQGFQFVADPRATGIHGRAIRAAAFKALGPEMENRAERLAGSPAESIHLSEHGRLVWEGAVIARLLPQEALKPKVELLASDLLEGAARRQSQEHLEKWLESHIESRLAPLLKLARAQDIAGLARGLAFRMVENFGSLERSSIAQELASLDQAARAQLRRYGVRFGAFSVFLPALLKPAPATLLAVLRALTLDEGRTITNLPPFPHAGLTSAQRDPALPQAIYEALGFRICGERAVRRDMLERLADLIRDALKQNMPAGGFTVSAAMMSLTGTSAQGLGEILSSLGFRMQHEKHAAPAAPSPDGPAEGETVAPVEMAAQAQAETEIPIETEIPMMEVWRPRRSHRTDERQQRARTPQVQKKPTETSGSSTQEHRARPHAQDKSGRPRRHAPPRQTKAVPTEVRQVRADPNSPFAVLRTLLDKKSSDEDDSSKS